ncbi:MAG TPA: FHA domain-containing protein [Planctomycetaceae bacterium]|nr:FHA domain-containing protein [Planctomycetaceae bacterium]
MAASLIPTEGGSPITLDKPIILIGRHQECDITLQTSSKVSRRHCCIVQVGERFVLRDLGSMNGIRINGHRVVETELCPGDEVAVADICFVFQRDETPKLTGKAIRGGIAVRPPADDVSSQIPVALSEEPLSDDDPEGYEPHSGIEDGISGVREKDDSHSAEHGFVSV